MPIDSSLRLEGPYAATQPAEGVETSELVPHYFGMATHELNWSTFLREPTSVDALLEKGDVVLKRRDGEALRLTRESKGAVERQAIQAAARLLSAGAFGTHGKAGVRSKAGKSSVTQSLPWTRFLPADDRRAFVSEFLSHLEACADLGDFTALGRLLAEWKNTAAAYAEGVADELKRPIKDIGGPVERPGR